MTIVRRNSPFGEMVSLRNAMDRLFDETFWRPTWVGRGLDEYQLPLDIQTTGESLVVKAALPGVKPEDVDITIDGNTLTISGKYEAEHEEDEQGYIVRELRRGTFSRSVALSSDLKTDQATAGFDNGIVTLTIPKAEQAKPRRIPVGNGPRKIAAQSEMSVESGAGHTATK